ncbi:MAG TPA: hypothetical protein VIK42_00500, partial [Bacteroidales bacterium]
WQSETGPSSGSGLASNLGLAQKMFDDLRLMRPQAWIDWQLMEESNDTWCLIRCNFATQEYNIIKNYYVRMQVTRFIKQGYKIIDTNHENVLAAINPAGTEMVAVLLNTSGSEKTFALDLSLFGHRDDKAKVYRTTATDNCKLLSSIPLDGKVLNYTLADQSMVTLILPVVLANYADYEVTRGITFEDGKSDLFSGEGTTLIVKKNDQRDGLNSSEYALSATIKKGQSITLTFEKPFYTSERARYLHAMMKMSDITHNGEIDPQSLVWKDYVVDLGTDTMLTKMTSASIYDSCTIWLDNLCINDKKEERAITEVSPVFDFETTDGIPTYELINKKDSTYSAQIIDNPDYAGLNALGHLFQYSLPPFSSFGSVNDTMRLHLDSPLRVTENTRYLHVMIKSSTTRIYFQSGSWSSGRKNILANKWVDVVVKMDSLMGQVLNDLAISPYSSSSGVTVYLDNICFNNDPTARTYVDEIEANVPYLLVSRNGGNVIETSGDQLMQSSFDASYSTPAQQWMLVPSNGHYAIVSRQDDRLITDNGSYFLALSTVSATDNSQLFDIQWLGDGYAKILSLSTGKAFDVQGSSTLPGALIGLWDYGTSANIHRQWALHRVPGFTATPTQSAGTDAGISFFTQNGQLNLYAAEVLIQVEIYRMDGSLQASTQSPSTYISFALTSGLYVVRAVNREGEKRFKVLVK